MDVADDIAYSLHDIEDAIHLNLIKKNDLNEYRDKFNIFREPGHIHWLSDLFDESQYKSKKSFGHMVHTLIQHVELNENNDFDHNILRYNAKLDDDAINAIKALKELIQERVLKSQEIRTIIYGGMITITEIFDAVIANQDELLSPYYRKIYNEYKTDNHKYRCVSDYISGMTDEYARHLHERLYGHNPGSVFEKL